MSVATLATFTDATFHDDVIASPVPVLVDVWATWCPPCLALEPALAALAKDHAGRLAVGKLNIESCPRVAGDLRVTSVPTLLLFQQGRVAGKLVGAASRARLDAFVAHGLAPRVTAAAERPGGR